MEQYEWIIFGLMSVTGVISIIFSTIVCRKLLVYLKRYHFESGRVHHFLKIIPLKLILLVYLAGAVSIALFSMIWIVVY